MVYYKNTMTDERMYETMPAISALEALNAAVSASNQMQRNSASEADFSSFLKTEKTLEDIYTEASQTYGVSVDLLKAMTRQESNFNPNATSRSGAQGLMQLMPATAASLGVTNAYDPYQNIMGGAQYIRKMLDKYNGNVSLALAAYNAGSNNVDKYGGIPPFAETQNYVAKITQYLAEGVDIPDSQTVYTAESKIKGDASVSYRDLNNLAGEILTEIFSYDDYMNYLSSLLGQDKTGLALSLSITSSSNEKDEDKTQAEPDSYIAYETLSNGVKPDSLTEKTELI
ncbi:MAG: lytic transglycosylase domain-containing protein [Eubacterium sp.]|nr:lytic transglycosylase domain-containing protein [Eubacterium sp.]